MFSSMLSLLGSLRGGSSFVTNSLRFRSSASANLSRTFSTPTNNNVWTYSGWIKRGQLSATQPLISVYIDASNYSVLSIRSDDKLEFSHVNAGVTYAQATSLAVFRDPSAYMHVVVVGNRDEAIDANRIKMYVNGVQITAWTVTPTWNAAQNVYLNQNRVHSIGRFNTLYFDGYLTDVNFIDGQALTPASFGAIDSSTGVWAPRPYSGTYGTNGFYLKFADASAATAAAIGKDSSGNGNNWTPSGISVTAGATYDSTIDVPVNYSDGGNGRGNYAVLNPLAVTPVAATFAEANLKVTTGAAGGNAFATMAIPSSGKWYWEVTLGSANNPYIGVSSYLATQTFAWQNTNSVFYSVANATKSVDGTSTSYGTTGTTNDVIGVAVDVDASTITFYKNNISQGAISHTFVDIYPALTDGGSATADIFTCNFGQRPFAYTPPAGFRALNTNNLPTPSIVNGANFMAATTYTGNAAARSLSNAVNSVSFQPDLVWIKSRTPGATNHALFDSVRGTTKYLSSDTTTGETTLAQSLTAFNADGFSLGTDTTLVNANANSYIAWQWRESITAGLDVVSYAGTGVDRTVAHNLGVAPAMIIVKRSQTGATSNWQVRHTSIAAANSIQLNSTNPAAAATTVWASTAPTSSVFTVGTSTDVNASGISYVAYCFAEIAGFSKFGSYTGNGSADGPFVFCGFRPRFVMYKRTDTTGDWVLVDSIRPGSNVIGGALFPNLPNAEDTAAAIVDITSNGFKLRTSGVIHNASGGTYIFAAFAENPSKYTLAR